MRRRALPSERHQGSRLNESFERHLAEVLRERLDDCAALVSCERLSGGANQETYRLVVRGAAGQRKLALRRAAGGSANEMITEPPNNMGNRNASITTIGVSAVRSP